MQLTVLLLDIIWQKNRNLIYSKWCEQTEIRSKMTSGPILWSIYLLPNIGMQCTPETESSIRNMLLYQTWLDSNTFVSVCCRKWIGPPWMSPCYRNTSDHQAHVSEIISYWFVQSHLFLYHPLLRLQVYFIDSKNKKQKKRKKIRSNQ